MSEALTHLHAAAARLAQVGNGKPRFVSEHNGSDLGIMQSRRSEGSREIGLPSLTWSVHELGSGLSLAQIFNHIFAYFLVIFSCYYRIICFIIGIIIIIVIFVVDVMIIVIFFFLIGVVLTFFFTVISTLLFLLLFHWLVYSLSSLDSVFIR